MAKFIDAEEVLEYLGRLKKMYIDACYDLEYGDPECEINSEKSDLCQDLISYINERVTKTSVTTVDVHKILDDVAQKKDRFVSIMIGERGTNLTITPLMGEDPKWTMRLHTGRPPTFKCGSCGAIVSEATVYCPHCGEKMTVVKVEVKNEQQTIL